MPVNTGFRDSRFGQFADPNFGSTLEGHDAPGVLPDTGAPAGQSASSDTNNGVISAPPTNHGFGGPGLMPQQGGGPVYLEDGGDPADTGNAQQAGATLDPMAVLNWGRKKFGLPEQFFGAAKPKSSNDPQATQQAMDDEGVTGKIEDPSINEFSKNQMIQNTPSDQTLRWGQNTDIPGQQKDSMYLADGGMIPDGSTDQEDQGDQDQMTPSGNAGGDHDPQAAMAYLSGKGAMPPDQVAAIEHAAGGDKVAALQNAGSPETAFGLMQHYRQKFNAYSAFAQAAIQGSGGRPPNGHAAADALNKAYEHVPDGKSVRFTPVHGGMRVTVGGNKPQGFANGGLVKGYDDGGEVEYDDQAQTQAGAIPDDQGQLPEERQQPDQDQDQGPVQKALGGRKPHEAVKDFVMSIPELLGWVKKDGQFDSVMENGFENTAPKGDQSGAPAGMEPGAAGTATPPMPKPQQSFMQGQPRDMGGSPVGPGKVPQSQAAPQGKPQEVGAKIGAQAARDPESTLKEILHNVDQMYPYVGQNTQRLAARNAALTAWMADRSKVEAEQTRGEHADKRAQIGAGARLGVADTNAGARRDVAQVGLQGRQLHEDAATGRSNTTNQTRAQIAGTREDRLDQRLGTAEAGRNYRTNVGANPGMSNDEALKRAQQAAPPRPPAGGPAAGPRPAQGATQGDGPAPQTPPPAGMKYQVNTSGTKWRLVPAQ